MGIRGGPTLEKFENVNCEIRHFYFKIDCINFAA